MMYLFIFFFFLNLENKFFFFDFFLCNFQETIDAAYKALEKTNVIY